jgi:hypothetical protein
VIGKHRGETHDGEHHEGGEQFDEAPNTHGLPKDVRSSRGA